MASNLKICIQNIQTGLYKWFEFPESDFGAYLIEELSAIKIPDNIQPYFDYEAYGRDARLELNCVISDQYYAWQ